MKTVMSHIILTGVLAVAVFASSSFVILQSSSIPNQSAFATLSGEDGKITFNSNRDGNWEIYVMNADGSGQTNISNHPHRDSNPDWGADGTKIAFDSGRDSGGSEIYVMNADGSNPVRLTPRDDDAHAYFPKWSPDGTKIAFVTNGEIYVMNADGSNPTRLTNNPGSDTFPSWSPDGTKIAFASDISSGRSQYEIYVMNADGSGQTRLTNNPGIDEKPDWSPDGTKIAFASNGDSVNSQNYEIYVMNADNGDGQTRLTPNTNPFTDYYPSWSPDGTEIAFQSHDRLGRGQIYVMNADGSGQTNISNNLASDGSPDWGADGAAPPPPPDTTAPIITVPDGMTVEATSPDGAEVSFEEEVSATDDVDGPVDVTCDYNSGDTFPIGETVVTCSAEDAAGNSAEETFTVTVQDTTDPDVEITQVVDRRNRVLEEGDTTPTPYIRVTFEATDAVGVDNTECSLDGQVFTSCTSPVVYDRLSRGTHQVTVRATDEVGNIGEDRFLFTVGSPPSNASPPGRQ